ncbi:GNAT family N-acetyltransferase [Amycolatopsis thailandensis]|uniref:GNAT family N-acetyltransferase n=1 Tax=Amycolatopsis thailandensis TaxID=589330 RepID=A0A229SGI3_9PSEU|nr:N-acetyltransferase [Amycolatopsis thailandensis]OXM57821.1 GNAT family N-acetyltransferase [Amycolatopsis thailandensis]
MLLRQETPADREAIHAVHLAAFAKHSVPVVEAKLVDALREDGDLIGTLSIVAERDGKVVGHVCCSPSRLGADEKSTVGLGPLGVLPEYHASGIGSALVHAVLGAADALGYGAVILLGDPKYYSRFGFVLAGRHGITPPVAEWAPHFQVRTLNAYRPELRGEFRYSPAFDRL